MSQATDKPAIFVFSLRQWPDGPLLQRAFDLPESAMDIGLGLFGEGPEPKAVFEAVPEREDPVVNAQICIALDVITRLSFADPFLRKALGAKRRYSFHFDCDVATFARYAEEDGYRVVTMEALVEAAEGGSGRGLVDAAHHQRASWEAEGLSEEEILTHVLQGGHWGVSKPSSHDAYLLAQTRDMARLAGVAERFDGASVLARILDHHCEKEPLIPGRYAAFYAAHPDERGLLPPRTIARVVSLSPATAAVFEAPALAELGSSPPIDEFVLVWALATVDAKATKRLAPRLAQVIERICAEAIPLVDEELGSELLQAAAKTDAELAARLLAALLRDPEFTKGDQSRFLRTAARVFPKKTSAAALTAHVVPLAAGLKGKAVQNALEKLFAKHGVVQETATAGSDASTLEATVSVATEGATFWLADPGKHPVEMVQPEVLPSFLNAGAIALWHTGGDGEFSVRVTAGTLSSAEEARVVSSEVFGVEVGRRLALGGGLGVSELPAPKKGKYLATVHALAPGDAGPDYAIVLTLPSRRKIPLREAAPELLQS